MDIYLITVLSSSYFIIMDRKINSAGHGKNVVDRLNSVENIYLKKYMEIIGKLVSNDTSNIGILPCTSKYISIKFADQWTHPQ